MLLRLLELVQAERDLGFGQEGAVLERPFCSRCQEVLGDVETPAELAQELEGRDAVTGLDPRDVGGRAARERQLALAEPDPFPRGLESLANRGGAVDVG